MGRNYPVVDYGKRLYLFDKSGKRYIDACGGAMVASLGHGNAELVSDISAQLSRVSYVNGMQFTSDAAEALATRLAKYAEVFGAKPSRYLSGFLSSGSEAVEAAIKFVRQTHVENGQPKRFKIIARTPGYHGNTLMALAASGRPHYKKLYGPYLHDVILTEAPYEYRSAVENYSKDGAAYYAGVLEKAILAAGKDEVAAFLFEPVIGSSAGASCPPPGYLKAVHDVCRKYGVLIIVDEVLCGSGRTGEFFASSLEKEFVPDVVVLGKGISAGVIPLSAVMVRSEYLQAMKVGTGNFVHAQTFLHAPSLTGAGLATMKYLDRHGVLANAKQQGAYLHQKLHEICDSHDKIGFVTGRGCLAGIEFVKDKKAKTPFPRGEKRVEKFVDDAFDSGLILWPNTGQANGVDGDLVMIAPPLNSTQQEIDELILAFQKILMNTNSFT